MLKFVFPLILSCQLIFSQKTFISYYNNDKNKKREVFETDKKGIKNGTYKYYNQSGDLIEEGTYKAGKKYGVYSEFTRFPNSNKMQLKLKELYIDDTKSGSATYYSYDADIGVYETKKGNYKNDLKEGIWIVITPLVKVFNPVEFENFKNIPAFKNSLGAKANSTYNNGVEVMPEGKQEVFYYPSGKLYHSYTLKNGKLSGTDLYLFPDGKAWSTVIYDENNKYISSVAYYYSGQLKQKEISEPYSYEGYNEDGSQDKVMGVKNNEATARKNNAEKLNAILSEAKKMAADGNTLAAMAHLETGINQYIEWKKYTFNYSAVVPEELQTAQDLLDKLKNQKK